MTCMVRDPLLFFVRILTSIVVAIFIGVLYQGAGVGESAGCPSSLAESQDIEKLSEIRERMEDEITAISNNLGNWFFAIIFVQFSSMLPTVLR